MSNEIISESNSTCITCGNELTGNFCSQCGEKKLNPAKDYSIGKFLEQTIDGFTHFDSKFLRSFKALLFKPGLLTLEFIRGKRSPYMKPVQMFIIAGILFYFLFPTNSTFYHDVRNMGKGENVLKFDANQAIQKKVAADSSTVRVVIKEINAEAAHKSKAYLFLIIPFWGIAFYLLFRKSIPYLVPHFVFAAHNLSFCILLFLIYLSVFYLLGRFNVNDYGMIPLVLILLAYLFIAIRRVYQQNRVRSALKSLATLGIFLLLFVLYRQIITVWTLSS